MLFVLRECIWNVPAVSLDLPTFDDAGSLGYLPRQVIYLPGSTHGVMVVDWIWRLYNMSFESGVVTEDWRFAVIVLLYKGKGERTEYRNYKGA